MKFKTLTPLIMSGADQKRFEFREMSISGAMRYWYRKLYGVTNEEDVFGSTERKGAFKLYVSYRGNYRLIKELQVHGGKFLDPGYGRNYFLGMFRKEAQSREAFSGEMDLWIRYPQRFEKEILGSLWAIVFLGGLGTRSRRGFGSLHVVSIDGTSDYMECFERVSRECVDMFGFRYTPAIYTTSSFSEEIYRDEIEKDDKLNHFNGRYRRGIEKIRPPKIPCHDPMKCLDFFGWTFQMFRSYLEPDYSIARRAVESGREFLKVTSIRRSDFGTPINFFFSSIKNSRNFTRVESRIPSRLLLRIYKNGANYTPAMVLDTMRPSPRKVHLKNDLLMKYISCMEKAGFGKVIP